MLAKKNARIVLAMLGLMILSCAVSAQDSSFVQAMRAYKAKDYQVALPLLDAALEEELRQTPRNDSLIAEIHYRRGVVLGRTSDLSGSVRAYKECLRIHLSLDPRDSATIASLYNNLGNKYMALADYPKSLAYHQKALDLRIAFHGPDSDPVAASYNMIGIVYELDKDFQRSIEYYQKSLKIRMSDPETPRKNFGIVWINIANMHLANGNYPAAQEAFGRGLAFLDIRDPRQQEYFVPAYSGMGITAMKLGDPDGAEKYFERALDLSIKVYGPAHRETAKIHLDIAENAALRGNYEDALRKVQLALRSFLPRFRPATLYDNPDQEMMTFEPWLFEALYDKASYLRQRFEQGTGDPADLLAAMACFELAIWQVEHIKHSFSADDAKDFIAVHTYTIYEDAIAVALMLARTRDAEKFQEKAFAIAEKSRGVLLLESLIKLEARSSMGVPDSIYERGLALDLAIATLRARSDSLAGDSLSDLVLEKEAFLHEFKEDYPAFFDLKYGDELAGPSDVRRTLLGPGDMLLEYVLGNRQVFVFALDRQGMQVRQFVRDSLFDHHLKTYQESLSRPPNQAPDPRGAYHAFGQAAWYLYQKLLEPEVGTTIRAGEKAGRLLIVPDGELWHIPFEPLLTAPAGKDLDYAGLPYLMRDFELSYGWSATLLAKDSLRGAGEEVRWLGYAPDAGAFTREGLPPLPGAQESSREIARLFNGQLMEDARASEAHFKTETARFNVLHLATHATLDDQHPDNSRIFLHADPDSLEDGQLNAYEVFGLDLNAKLVVLSACNTGNGKVIRGEGIASLARGFAQAGCPNVVMSLWSAQDGSTSRIMETFYEGLAEGKSTGEALRASKLSYLGTASTLEAHPYYWSVFESIGRSARFVGQQSGGRTRLLWWLLGGMGAVLVIFWRLRKKIS